MESADPDALERLGLSENVVNERADVYVRIPRNRESVYRAVVLSDGVPVCDIFQVWPDVAQHPSRGREQADLIWKKVLEPALIDQDE